MFKTIERITGRVADYTLGTVIVMAHILMADRRSRALLPGPALRQSGQMM
jgi:hypothetical protein